MISIGVHCIAYDKHRCALTALLMISIVVYCIGITLIMISIVVQCFGNKLLMKSIFVHSFANDKHRCAFPCL